MNAPAQIGPPSVSVDQIFQSGRDMHRTTWLLAPGSRLQVGQLTARNRATCSLQPVACSLCGKAASPINSIGIRYGRAGILLLLLATATSQLAACEKNASARGGGAARSSAVLGPNRSYSGAPPVIPHKVRSLGRGRCLSCHRDGDATDKGKVAPRTPHPELERCEQCHLERTAARLFKPNSFVGGAYGVGQRPQSWGPWLIPHPLTMRENCIGCHASTSSTSAAPQTTHPERVRCRQCHLPASEGWPGPRAGIPGKEGQQWK